ncbi:carotenoid biosynthesis protein [Bradyrhizobium sp. C9]|uniref:carotenoid biosynthesis protein n=1 Tax=Bradyrhizobium sp. C9 TaxID=142585 RepID=UPI001303FE75|nr:carotenoid biosynthesis protein [Bradyrhizobium sp. C9]
MKIRSRKRSRQSSSPALRSAALAYDPRRASILFASCSTIALTMESLGTATGFPFGSYHFELGADLPISASFHSSSDRSGSGWLFFVDSDAPILLDGADRQLDWPFNLIALLVVAAFVVSQLDILTRRARGKFGSGFVLAPSSDRDG